MTASGLAERQALALALVTLGERGAECRKVAGDLPSRPLALVTLGERGAGKGGFPGPALSVRLFVGHALPTEKSQIPELLSEGGSKSRSRLIVTVRASGFHAVALVWRAGKRALKTARTIGFGGHEPPGHATQSAGIGQSPSSFAPPPEAS